MKKGEGEAGTQALPHVKEQGAEKQLPKQEIQVALRAWDKHGLRTENGGKKWPVRVGMRQHGPCGWGWAQRNL